MLIKIAIPTDNLFVIYPLGYHEFNYLVERAKSVITNATRINEETIVMRVPCITSRENTERPETVCKGRNELLGTNPKAVKPYLEKLFNWQWKKGSIPKLWDGKAAERIINELICFKKPLK